MVAMKKMVERPTKAQIRRHLDTLDPEFRRRDEADAALAELDVVAREMETRWGAGRLQVFAGEFLAVKFDSQAEKLDEALAGNDRARIAQRARAMKRGWEALDAAAREKGHVPPEAMVWHGKTPNGRAFALVRDAADALRVGQGVPVFTLDDIGTMLNQAGPQVAAVKQAFPDARVKRSKIDWVEGDALPW